MDRSKSIQYITEHKNQIWDIIVIGGGATGLGIGLDAALRGYKVLLLEQSDFTKGTSSRSTKLVHGGVRYLAQGNISLVFEALHERGLLLQNAPHLTENQSFLVPAYTWTEAIKYIFGLKIYDLLAATLSLGKSRWIHKDTMKKHLPNLKAIHLKSGILYHDGQFDDTRLGINLGQSIVKEGGYVINYMKVSKLLKDKNNTICGVKAIDQESQIEYSLSSKVVINATGVFVDDIIAMDQKQKSPMVKVSQGTHIVLDKSFLPSNHALMIPKTDDGRVLFAVPWQGKLVVGTTDTIVDDALLEPIPLQQEVEFILRTFNRYVEKQASKQDVLSVFCGLRPLANAKNKLQKTKEMSRSHTIVTSPNQLITITGGKWTTYRKMAEDTMAHAIRIGKLSPTYSKTLHYKIHGGEENTSSRSHLRSYGTDEPLISKLMEADPQTQQLLHPDYPYQVAQVIWAVRCEMARTVEDVLARRLRILFLDAKAALKMAPKVAEIMAKELENDEHWIEEQIDMFQKIARNYLLDTN